MIIISMTSLPLVTQVSMSAQRTCIMKNVFDLANMPTEPEKKEGPATVINLLGMEVDSIRLEIRLPLEKLIRLKSLIESWWSRWTLFWSFFV